jgi:hypothetical protein
MMSGVIAEEEQDHSNMTGRASSHFASEEDIPSRPVENHNAKNTKTGLQMGHKYTDAKLSLLSKRLNGLLQKPIKGSLAKNLQ